jgi:diguanylate cyclase (GGDEF)-like protein
MRTLAWKTYLGVTVLLIAGYLAVPGDDVLDGWLVTAYKTGIGWLGAAAVVFGVRRYRPPATVAWLLFAAGVFLNATGILVESFELNVLGKESYPMVADGFWLSLYPGLIIGLAMLIRRRSAGRDWASLVDATTITTGLGLLSWVFVIKSATQTETFDLVGQAVVIAYPVGDVVVLAMLVRLLLGSGRRTPAFMLMTGSLLAFLAGDVVWAVIARFGWETGPTAMRCIDMIFMLAYTLFGAATLHPSVREVGRPATPAPPRLSPALLTTLACTSLIAPAILAVQVARKEVTDGGAIVVGSVTLFLLVVTRMAQLLRQVEGQARQLRDLARVDELTGLPNRRAWSVELPAAIERARRDRIPLTVAMIDLDHFKRFNDQFGHPAGDRLLKGVAAGWANQLRAVDQLARYGGEEFILLLPAADGPLAATALDRLRPVTPAGQTFSAGAATWDGTETSEELIARADRALYAAKDAGRNQTIVADSPRDRTLTAGLAG